MPGNRSPGFSPPIWPRFSQQRNYSKPFESVAPAPAEIPLCWLSKLSMRLDAGYTIAEITRDDGTVARAKGDTSRGVFPYPATLQTATDEDALALAQMIVDFQSDPAMRSPIIAIELIYRSDTERAMLLGITRGQRVRLTQLPTEFPASAASFKVAGIRHFISLTGHRLEFTAGRVIGVNPGVPGPFFRWDSSEWGGGDIIPF